ncbi:hypothetical protein HPB48_019329 [Haemaphysalis longicornis]|uniref:CCHC-type domain-containing protein n=1 Tax=Haemaphysalis longicornis TaxID=44386 RepID=A0A9J6G993_HAELO|nr:hypothetical protein HPB48_019329 [Haemaphysalis longicornis]
MEPVVVQGEDISPDMVTPERGWLECYRQRGARTLQQHQSAQPSSSTAKQDKSSRQPRKPIRPPQLPREHLKIIIRPRNGLDVTKAGMAELRDAILRAAVLQTNEAREDIMRTNPEKNIVVVSTPSLVRAEKYNAIASLSLHDLEYPTTSYAASPEGTSKGVIHGIPAYDSPEDITASIIHPGNPTALQARRMGRTNTVLIVFEGFRVPHYLYYRGAEYRCHIHRRKTEACLSCGALGHRADVCPNPDPSRCQQCGVQVSPSDQHSCEPTCVVCGGRHVMGDKLCKQRFQPPIHRSHPHTSIAQRQVGAVPTDASQKQAAEVSEKLAIPPKTTAATQHEAPSTARLPPNTSTYEHSAGESRGKPPQRTSGHHPRVSWSVVASRSPQATEIAHLKQLLDMVLAENETLKTELKTLKASINSLTPPSTSTTRDDAMDTESPSTTESEAKSLKVLD